MHPLVRRVLSVIGGVILAGLVVNTIGALADHLYPLKEGTNPDEVENVRLAVQALPLPAFLLVLAGCMGGGAVAAYAATEFSGRSTKWPGLAAGVMVLAASVTTILLPYPVWVRIAAVVLVPGAAFAGTRFAMRHPADTDPL